MDDMEGPKISPAELVVELIRVRSLLDQTQAKLEEQTREKHRLEQENIGLKRKVERLEKNADQLLDELADSAEFIDELAKYPVQVSELS